MRNLWQIASIHNSFSKISPMSALITIDRSAIWSTVPPLQPWRSRASRWSTSPSTRFSAAATSCWLSAKALLPASPLPTTTSSAWRTASSTSKPCGVQSFQNEGVKTGKYERIPEICEIQVSGIWFIFAIKKTRQMREPSIIVTWLWPAFSAPRPAPKRNGFPSREARREVAVHGDEGEYVLMIPNKAGGD